MKIYSLKIFGILVLIVIPILMFPFSSNGLLFDDANISSVYWDAKLNGVSIYEYIWNQILAWMHVNGRFTPIAIIQTYSLSYFIQDEKLFRLLHVLWILVHVFTFAWLLRTLRLGWETISLWALLLIGLLQARNYHDPIAAYGFFMQSQGILLVLAIFYLVKWTGTPCNKFIVLSAVFASISLLMYEINLVFYPIAFGILLMARQPNLLKIQALIVLLAPAFVYTLINVYLRSIASINYSGLQIGSPSLMLVTYGKQFLSAFPGVFYFFQWRTEFPVSNVLAAFFHSQLTWLLFVVASYLIFGLLTVRGGAKGNDNAGIRVAYLIAFCLTFITPAFIAISSKYQSELTWGMGYIPVYYAYFGVALLLATSIQKISKRFVHFRLISALLLASLITANYIVNRDVLNELDQMFVAPRAALVHDLKNGLFNELNDGDSLIFQGPTYFYGFNSAFFYRYSGKKIFISDALDPQAVADGKKYYTLVQRGGHPIKWDLIPPKSIVFSYGDGWSISENSHRWSVSKRAVISLFKLSDKKISGKLVFSLNTIKPRNVKFSLGGKVLSNFSKNLNGIPVQFEIPLIDLPRGQSDIIIDSDVDPASPGGVDTRMLSFVISNVGVIESDD